MKNFVNAYLEHHLWDFDRVRSRTRPAICMKSGGTGGRIGDMSLVIGAIKVIPIPTPGAKLVLPKKFPLY